jgi:hypothetical protein
MSEYKRPLPIHLIHLVTQPFHVIIAIVPTLIITLLVVVLAIVETQPECSNIKAVQQVMEAVGAEVEEVAMLHFIIIIKEEISRI